MSGWGRASGVWPSRIEVSAFAARHLSTCKSFPSPLWVSVFSSINEDILVNGRAMRQVWQPVRFLNIGRYFHQYHHRCSSPPLTRINGAPTYIQESISMGHSWMRSPPHCLSTGFAIWGQNTLLGSLIQGTVPGWRYAGTSDKDPRKTVSCPFCTGEQVLSEVIWTKSTECPLSAHWVCVVLNTLPVSFFYSSAQFCEVLLLSTPLQMEKLRHRRVKHLAR